jgi:DnaK suppressor protein
MMLQQNPSPPAASEDMLRQQLTKEREGIERELKDIQQSLATVQLDQTSVGRLSRMDALQQQSMALGLRERLLFRQRRVGAALLRMETQTYGRCCECETPISIDRLLADPAAPFCPDCQAEIDDRRRSR